MKPEKILSKKEKKKVPFTGNDSQSKLSKKYGDGQKVKPNGPDFSEFNDQPIINPDKA